MSARMATQMTQTAALLLLQERATSLVLLRALVRQFLEQEEERLQRLCPKHLPLRVRATRLAPGWTFQGLGMMRYYLGADRGVRLHLWDTRRAERGVSVVHDHPWHFSSTIVCGQMVDVVYRAESAGKMLRTKPSHVLYPLKCGKGAHIVAEAGRNVLLVPTEKLYRAGETYGHKPTDLHESQPEAGTVTLVVRSSEASRDARDAHVAVPIASDGTSKWGSAEPRDATCDEVRAFLFEAMQRLRAEYVTSGAAAARRAR